MSSKELARLRSSANLAQITELEAILLTGELPNAETVADPQETQRQMIAQLLDAQSDDELENFGNAESWRDYLGVPIEIHGFRWLPSEYDEGPAVFMVVSVTDLTDGTHRILTTGMAMVMAQLANMAKRGVLTGAVRRLVERETRQKYRAYHLETPEGVKAARAADEQATVEQKA